MIIGIVEKQPSEKLDYDIDYSLWLYDGDSVSTVSVVVPDGLTLISSTVDSPVVKLWVSGGVNGSTYKLEITATTAHQRIKQDELKIKVKER